MKVILRFLNVTIIRWQLVSGLLLSWGAMAQNLVPDGGFEAKKYCPNDFNEQKLNQLEFWQQPTQGTPDYFHRCSKKVGVPDNMFGTQEAFEGDGYVGLVLFSSGTKNYREYLQVKLTRPLSAGEMVCVEISLSPAEKTRFICDGLGMHLSADRPSSSRMQILPVDAQIDNPRLHLFDQWGEWVTLSDAIIARGGEEYLTIGNFKPDRSTVVLRRSDIPGVPMDLNMAYIYVDDVKVIPVKSREECSCYNEQIAAGVKDPPVQMEESSSVEFRNVLFEFDKSVLEVEARAELDKVAATLKRRSALYLEVIGHTDLTGPAGYNLDLSRERAEAVIDYLVSKGVQESRLSIRFFGASQPAAENTTAEGRAQNRRVEFEIRQKTYESYQ